MQPVPTSALQAIRPFVLTDEERLAPPAAAVFKDAVGPKAKGMKFEIAVSV